MSTVHTTPTTVNISTQKVDVVAELQAFIDGVNGMLTGIDPFILIGQTLPKAQLLAQVEKLIAAITTTKANRKTLAQNVADERAQMAVVKPFRKAMKTFLIARYGENSPVLQQFGYRQYRRPKTSAASRASGVAKSTATKKARRTKATQPAPVAAATGANKTA